MMGPKQEAQPAQFYEVSLDGHVPQDHLLRPIDRFVDLSDIRQYLAEFYSHTGRPSIEPIVLFLRLLRIYACGSMSGSTLSFSCFAALCCEDVPSNQHSCQ